MVHILDINDMTLNRKRLIPSREVSNFFSLNGSLISSELINK